MNWQQHKIKRPVSNVCLLRLQTSVNGPLWSQVDSIELAEDGRAEFVTRLHGVAFREISVPQFVCVKRKELEEPLIMAATYTSTLKFR